MCNLFITHALSGTSLTFLFFIFSSVSLHNVFFLFALLGYDELMILWIYYLFPLNHRFQPCCLCSRRFYERINYHFQRTVFFVIQIDFESWSSLFLIQIIFLNIRNSENLFRHECRPQVTVLRHRHPYIFPLQEFGAEPEHGAIKILKEYWSGAINFTKPECRKLKSPKNGVSGQKNE